MTRETDIYLPPETRTVIANQKQADIFISVHANASRNRKLSGVETFYLNLSQDPTVVETACPGKCHLHQEYRPDEGDHP